MVVHKEDVSTAPTLPPGATGTSGPQPSPRKLTFRIRNLRGIGSKPPSAPTSARNSVPEAPSRNSQGETDRPRSALGRLGQDSASSTPAGKDRKNVTFGYSADQHQETAACGSAHATAKMMKQQRRAMVANVLRHVELFDHDATWSAAESQRHTLHTQEAKANADHKVVQGLLHEPLSLGVAKKPSDLAEPESPQGADNKVAVKVPTDDIDDSPETGMPDYIKQLKDLYIPQGADETSNFTLAAHEQVDSDTALRTELERMVTGEDAIAFFATHSEITPVKFLHCKRRTSEEGGLELRPYDLIVCDEKERGPEYFTISQKGVVHVCPGQPSEHTSLSDWMHQSMTFSVLRSMIFFKYYVHTKIFGSWKGNVRQATYNARRLRLSRRLFLAKPVFVEPLMKVHSIMYDVRCTKVLDINQDGIRALELKAWLDLQRAIRGQDGHAGALKELDQRMEQVMQAVESTVKDVTEASRAEQEDYDPRQKKAIPMVVEKAMKERRAHRLKLSKLNSDMLGVFIRLVDSMCQGRLVETAVAAAVEVLEKLRNTPKLFTTTVSFGAGDPMEFTPSRKEFLDGFQETFQKLIEVVGSDNVKPLVTMPLYSRHLRRRALPENVEDCIRNDLTFQWAEKCIQERVNSDYDKAQKFADIYFEPYRKIHKYGLTWDKEAFEARNHSHFQLAREMALMKDFEDELEKLKPAHVCGYLFMEARTLRELLVPIARTGLSTMKEKLKGLARERCRQVTHKFEKVNKDLEQRPQQIDKFAEFAKLFQATKANMETLDDMKASVEDMYLMIRQYGVKVDTQDQVDLETLHEQATDFQQRKVIEASAFIRENVEMQCEEVAKRAEKLEEEGEQILESMETGEGVDENNVDFPEKVIPDLAEIGATLDKAHKNCQWVNDCERLFKQPRSTFQKLKQARQCWELRLRLWELILQWKDLTRGWSSGRVVELDVDRMALKISVFDSATTQLEEDLSDDVVVITVRKRILMWQERLTTVGDLANAVMKPRHWDHVFKLLGSEKGFQSATTTLETLEKAGVFKNPAPREISAISAKASAEYALESSLEKVIQVWHQQELGTTNYRGLKDVFVLNDLSALKLRIKDHRSTIYVVLASKFAESVKAKAVETLEKLNTYEEIFICWEQVQKGWMLLEPLLNDDKYRKGEFMIICDKFAVVDKWWRETMRRMRSTYRTVREALNLHWLAPSLRENLEKIDVIKQHTSGILQANRAACPRMHFLADDELVQMLSDVATNGPGALVPYAPRLFCGVAKLDCETVFKYADDDEPGFQNSSVRARALVSAEGEVAPLLGRTSKSKYDAEDGGAVDADEWISKVEEMMRSFLRDSIMDAFMNLPADGPASTWLSQTSVAQAALVALSLSSSQCIETALRDESVSRALNQLTFLLETRIESFVSLLNKDKKIKEMTKAKRIRAETAILQTLHARDVVTRLCDFPHVSPESFEFKRHLRMSFDTDRSSAVAWVLDTTIDYAHEYLGVAPRLAATPITERCTLSIASAIQLQYSIAVAGPSGVGKTETVRGVAAYVGAPSYAFAVGNDCVDAETVCRTICGLVAVGAWGTIDGLECAQPGMLSAIAEMLRSLIISTRAGLDVMEIGSYQVRAGSRPARVALIIRSLEGCGAPLDPMGKWPHHLIPLVRPVALLKPDTAALLEATLLCKGLDGNVAGVAAKRLAALVEIAEAQAHPDSAVHAGAFSLRAIRDAVSKAGETLNAKASVDTVVGSCFQELAASVGASDVSVEGQWLRGVALQFISGAPSQPEEAEDEDVSGGGIDPRLFQEIEEYFAKKKLSIGLDGTFLERVLDLHCCTERAPAVLLTGSALTGKTTATQALAVATTRLSRGPSDKALSAAAAKSAARRSGIQEEQVAEAVEHVDDAAAVDLGTIREDAEEEEEEPSPSRKPTKNDSSSADDDPESHDGQAPPKGEDHGASEAAEVLRGNEELQTEGKTGQDNVEQPPGFPLRRVALYPAALTPQEMYGYKHQQNSWHDGVFTALLKHLQEQRNDKTRYFVVLDGEVSPEWSDVLEPALDPSGQRNLLLSSGEYCQVPESVTFVLETTKLWQASPGLVGRCGVCTMDDALSWKDIIEVLLVGLEELLPDFAEHLKAWIPALCEGVLPFVRRHCPWVTEITIIHSFVTLCTAVLSERNGVLSNEYKEESLQLWLIYASVWGFGSFLDDNDKPDFGTHMVQVMQEADLVDSLFTLEQLCKGLANYTDMIGEEEYGALVAQNMFKWKMEIESSETKAKMIGSEASLPKVPTAKVGQIMFVSTAESEMLQFTCEQLIRSQRSFFLAGSGCVGKTAFTKELLQGFEKSGNKTHYLRLRHGDGCTAVAKFVEGLTQKQLHGSNGSASEDFTCIAVDDVHLGSKGSSELLRQLTDQGGFYDCKQNAFKRVKNAVLAVVGAQRSRGDHEQGRWFSNFNNVRLQSPSEDSLKRIFSSISPGWASHASAMMQGAVPECLNSIILSLTDISRKLAPTPSRPHLTYGIYDAFKVAWGVYSVSAVEVATEHRLKCLFWHEADRQFGDRLSSAEEKKILHESFQACGLTPPHTEREKHTFYMNFDNKVKEYVSVGEAVAALTEALAAKGSPMGVISYHEEFLRAVASACRSLRLPQSGGVMLLGPSGTGKRTVASLAARLTGKSIPLTLEGSCNPEDDGTPAVLRYTIEKLAKAAFDEKSNKLEIFGPIDEAQLQVSETLLSYVDTILSNGWLSKDIWPGGIVPFVTEVVDQRNGDSLRFIVCLSPPKDPSTFRRRLRQFPRLLDLNSIWLHVWGFETRSLVAKRVMVLDNEIGASLKWGESRQRSFEEVAALIPHSLQKKAPHLYHNLLGGTAFTSMVAKCQELIATRYNNLTFDKESLQRACQRIREAVETMSQLQARRRQLKPESDRLVAALEAIDYNLNSKRQNLKSYAEALKEAVDEREQVMMRVQAVQKELDEANSDAKPHFEASEDALDSLGKSDFFDFKKVENPNSEVEQGCFAALLLLGRKQTWDEALKVFSGRYIIDELKGFNPLMEVNEGQLARLLRITKSPEWKNISKSRAPGSTVAKALALWAYAVEVRFNLEQSLEPRKRILAQEQAEMVVSEDKVRQAKVIVDNAETMIAELEKELSIKKIQARNIDKEGIEIVARLEVGQKLLDTIQKHEKVWAEKAQVLTTHITDLPANALLVSGFAHFCGALGAAAGFALVDTWRQNCKDRGIPVSPGESITDFEYGLQTDIGTWERAGLPKDSMALARAFSAFRCRPTPLLLDPQGLARRWLRRLYGPRISVFPSADAKRPDSGLAMAVKEGISAMVVVSGQSLPVELEPLLLNAAAAAERRHNLLIGGRDTMCHDAFRLFLVTPSSAPCFPTDAWSRVTVIDFAMTGSMVEEVALSLICEHELPEFEEQRKVLGDTLVKNNAEVEAAERRMLQQLGDQNVDMFAGDDFAVTLAKSQRSVDSILEHIVDAEKQFAGLTMQRASYRKIAALCSALFRAIFDTEVWHPSYQASWPILVRWVQSRLKEMPENNVVQTRVDSFILQAPIAFLGTFISGFMEIHRLPFAFRIAVRLAEYNNVEDEYLLNLIVDGLGTTASLDPDDGQSPDWISSLTWRRLRTLARLQPAFKLVRQSIEEMPDPWQRALEAGTPPEWENMPNLPDMSPFQELLLTLTLMPHLLVPGLRHFIVRELGENIAEIAAPVFHLETEVQEASADQPLLILLEDDKLPGDVVMELSEVAVKSSVNLDVISAAAPQFVERADAAVTAARNSGDWVCIIDAETSGQSLEMESVCVRPPDVGDGGKPQFRLVLLARSRCKISGGFGLPPEVACGARRVATGAPRSIRANMLSLLETSGNRFAPMLQSTLNPDTGEESESQVAIGKDEADLRMRIAGFLAIHAISAGRSRFGVRGWPSPYIWPLEDFRCGLSLVEYVDYEFLSEVGSKATSNVDLIFSLLGYGARISGDVDRRLLKDFLNTFVLHPRPVEAWSRLAPPRLASTIATPQSTSLPELTEFVDLWPLDDEHADAYCLSRWDLESAQSTEARLMLGELRRASQVAREGAVAVLSTVNVPRADGVALQVVQELLEELSTPFTTFLEAATNENADMQPASPRQEGAHDEIRQTLDREWARMQRLLTVVQTDLTCLLENLSGFKPMSERSEEISACLARGSVPQLWLQLGPQLSTPVSVAKWKQRICGCCAHFNEWRTTGTPLSVWLGALQRPKDLLTSVLRMQARMGKQNIEGLAFRVEVKAIEAPDVPWDLTNLRSMVKAPKNGIHVHGIYIDGAQWDAGLYRLVDKPAQTTKETSMPLVLLEAMSIDQKNRKGGPSQARRPSAMTKTPSSTHSCPVYCSWERNGNPVTFFDLPVQDDVSWIKRGVALTLEEPL